MKEKRRRERRVYVEQKQAREYPLKRRRALDVKELQEKKPDVTGIIGESKEEKKYELKTAAQAAEQFRRGETSEERMAAIVFLRQMISCGEEEIAAAIDQFLATNLLPEIMTIIKLKTCDLQMLVRNVFGL